MMKTETILMEIVLIANGKHFFDITDLLAKMMKDGWDRKQAIESLMKIDNCNQIGIGDSFSEATKNLLGG